MLNTAQRALAVGLLVGATFGAALGVPAGAIIVSAASADALPACQYEDGNPDGQPCSWTDPDTGRAFYVDSANYRG